MRDPEKAKKVQDDGNKVHEILENYLLKGTVDTGPDIRVRQLWGNMKESAERMK